MITPLVLTLFEFSLALPNPVTSQFSGESEDCEQGDSMVANAAQALYTQVSAAGQHFAENLESGSHNIFQRDAAPTPTDVWSNESEDCQEGDSMVANAAQALYSQATAAGQRFAENLESGSHNIFQRDAAPTPTDV